MKTNLIQIGNSKGIRIPKSLIERYQLNAEIELIPTKSGLLITSSSKARNGWKQEFKNSVAGQRDSDISVWQTVSNQFDNKEWLW